MFLRRGYPPPLLIDLLENATIIASDGANSDTTEGVYIYESMFPQSGTAYALLFYSGDIGIYKVVNRGTATRLYYTNYMSSDAVRYMQKSTDGWGNTVYYLGKSNYKYEAATMVAFTTTNPHADTILSGASCTRLAGTSYSSQQTISTNDTQHKAALFATSSLVTLWHCNGSSWTKGNFTTQNQAGTASGSTLTNTSYGCSIIGID